MTYQRPKNMAAFVSADSFFAAVHVGYKPRLQILALHTLNAAQRIFPIPDLRYYALADGIREVLGKAGRGIMKKNREEGGASPQLSLLWT